MGDLVALFFLQFKERDGQLGQLDEQGADFHHKIARRVDAVALVLVRRGLRDQRALIGRFVEEPALVSSPLVAIPHGGPIHVLVVVVRGAAFGNEGATVGREVELGLPADGEQVAGAGASGDGGKDEHLAGNEACGSKCQSEGNRGGEMIWGFV